MNTNNKLRYFKSAVAFSFCFSFTELQLETVSKAFHITTDEIQVVYYRGKWYQSTFYITTDFKEFLLNALF